MSFTSEILRMAVRNVGRNRRRSLLTGAMIAAAVGTVVFFQSYTLGIEHMMVSNAVESLTGALQVQRQEYADAQDFAPLTLDLPADGQLLAEVRNTPGVKGVAPRLNFIGSLIAPTGSANFVGLGMNAESEAAACAKGLGRDSIAGAVNPLVEGAPLGGENEGVVVAVGLAKGLGLKIGDSVTLQVKTKAGSMDTADTVVRGFFRLDDPMGNKLLVLVPLALAQKVLHMKGRATSLIVGLHDTDALGPIAAQLTKSLEGSTPALRALPWWEIVPFLQDTVELQRDTFHVVLVVVVLLVLVGVANTVMMSVLERRREIGTLMAIGFRRWAIISLVVIENLALGLFAASVGAAIGGAVVLATQVTGLGFSIPGGNVVLVYPELRVEHFVMAIGASLAGALVAALWPAWRASRLQPVVALRST